MEVPPERCCEIRDRREEGLGADDATWSDNGEEEGELAPRWGNAVLEAALRMVLCLQDAWLSGCWRKAGWLLGLLLWAKTSERMQ